MRLWTKVTQSKTTSGLGTGLLPDFVYRRFNFGVEFFFRETANLNLFAHVCE